MAQVTGVKAVIKALEDRKKKYGPPTPQIHVGYTQSYAIFVHENLEAYHPVGQAKFLEEPARTDAEEIARIVREGINDGLTLEQALLRGGLYLQRVSQGLCPVDTGALRASAFTEIVTEETSR